MLLGFVHFKDVKILHFIFNLLLLPADLGSQLLELVFLLLYVNLAGFGDELYEAKVLWTVPGVLFSFQFLN